MRTLSGWSMGKRAKQRVGKWADLGKPVKPVMTVRASAKVRSPEALLEGPG